MPEMFDKTFYDKMLETHNDVKHIVEWSKQHTQEDDERHEELTSRITKLENDKAKVIGGAGVLGAISGFLVKFLFK